MTLLQCSRDDCLVAPCAAMLHVRRPEERPFAGGSGTELADHGLDATTSAESGVEYQQSVRPPVSLHLRRAVWHPARAPTYSDSADLQLLGASFGPQSLVLGGVSS